MAFNPTQTQRPTFTFPGPPVRTGEVRLPGDPIRIQKPVNPYEKPFQELANSPLASNPYAGAAADLVGKVQGLGNKDYTAALRKMMLEDVDREQGRFNSQLRAMGSGELALAEDVTNRWANERTNASTRAAVQGAELQRAAYETAMNVISRASGQQLDALLAQLQALAAGGSNYNQFQQMLIPLMIERGRLGASGTGGDRQSPVYARG